MIEETVTTKTNNKYNYPEQHIERGWLCGRCGRINAPWVRQCDCSNRNNWNITWDDTTADNEQWKRYVTTTSDTFKIHPDDITYTTAHNPVGGSDYWDNSEKIWSNILKNVSNIKEIY